MIEEVIFQTKYESPQEEEDDDQNMSVFCPVLSSEILQFSQYSYMQSKDTPKSSEIKEEDEEEK